MRPQMADPRTLNRWHLANRAFNQRKYQGAKRRHLRALGIDSQARPEWSNPKVYWGNANSLVLFQTLHNAYWQE